VTQTPQQRAVEAYPLKPLRVVAGAGTGKTTTMAWRLARLVSEHGVEPEQALGITFTNKAAENLADQLRDRLAHYSAEGRQVEVVTYHAFANGIVAEFGALAGIERSAHVITPGYARELQRKALGDGDYSTLDLTAPSNRIEDLSALDSQMADHLLTADDIAAIADQSEPWGARLELIEAHRRYQQRKRDLGVADYGDLIKVAHEVVTSDHAIARRIRDRYRVVLLDEYQDTNPAQQKLLATIFDEGFAVTAVGDPNQTIYEWRGASLQNFANFATDFPDEQGHPAETLELGVNWRSEQRIVDVANRVSKHIAGDTGLGELKARPSAGDGYVAHAWLLTARDEADLVASEIRRLHDEEGRQWRDMAVIFRKNAQMSLIHSALEAEGVPVEVAALGGLLEVPAVADLHAWIRLLGRSDDASALMRILLGSKYRLGLGDAAPLAAWVRQRLAPHGQGDEREGVPGWAMLEAIDALEDVEGLGDEAAMRLRHLREVYHDLLQVAQGVSLAELSRQILDRTEVWPEVEALGDAARLSARLNLYRFLDLTEEWSPLEGRPSLDAFLDYLDALSEEAAAQELDTARLSGEDAVAMLTVHRSKGLEWDSVFLPAVVKGTFPAGVRRYDDPATQPSVVPYELRIDGATMPDLPEKVDDRKKVLRPRHFDQEWRTAYVAVTRAKQRLYCTGAFWYTDRKPKDPSELFELIATDSESLQTVDEPGDTPPPQAEPPQLAADPLWPDGWQRAMRQAMADPNWTGDQASRSGYRDAYDDHVDQIRMLLEGLPQPDDKAEEEEGFATSVTGLVTYATCPKRFMWSEVDRLPRRPSPAARRGVEMHRRIELHNRGAMPLDDDLDGFYDIGPGESARTSSQGAFEAFKGSRFAETKPGFIEVPFQLALPEGKVRGRIDAIYTDDKAWEVVDFKSGRRNDDPARRVQLEAYAVAATDVPFGAEPPTSLKVTFAYFGDGAEEFSEEVDEAWMASARQHLSELAGSAAAQTFEPTPSQACHNCDFLRFCGEGKAWVDS